MCGINLLPALLVNVVTPKITLWKTQNLYLFVVIFIILDLRVIAVVVNRKIKQPLETYKSLKCLCGINLFKEKKCVNKFVLKCFCTIVGRMIACWCVFCFLLILHSSKESRCLGSFV